ncbi:MAG: hypothetical protein FWD86_01870 [Firmicutes bacterium]|nr:hypothetical protein [Bacillota bacterium]
MKENSYTMQQLEELLKERTAQLKKEHDAVVLQHEKSLALAHWYESILYLLSNSNK